MRGQSERSQDHGWKPSLAVGRLSSPSVACSQRKEQGPRLWLGYKSSFEESRKQSRTALGGPSNLSGEHSLSSNSDDFGKEGLCLGSGIKTAMNRRQTQPSRWKREAQRGEAAAEEPEVPVGFCEVEATGIV